MGGALAELNRLSDSRGKFAAALAMEGQLRKRERAREHAANQAGRTIPTSGPGRRRAKTIRNRDAVKAMAAGRIAAATASAPDLLAQILDWCSSHPATQPLPPSGCLEMRREVDGTVTVTGAAPRILSISTGLLQVAGSQYLTFTRGVLTMHVQPETLHYRPLGPDPASFAVVFERVDAG